MEPVPVAVRIELGAPPPLLAEIARRSSAELDLLRTDLALPVRFDLEVVAAGAHVRLYVDGAELRLPQRSSADDAGLADAVLAALQTHRSAFVTPRVADAVWASWARSDAACPAACARLLRKLATYRLRIDRVADTLPAWGALTPQTAFETALSRTSRRIRVLLHPETAARYEAQRAALNSAPGEPQDPIAMMIDGLFYELGLHIGDCRLEADPALGQDECRVAINDLRGRLIQLMPAGQTLVNDTVERLRLLTISGRAAINPANGNECAFIARADTAAAEDAGLTTWDALGYLILATSAEVRSNAYALLSVDALEFLLSKLETVWPELVELTRSRTGEQPLAEILRLLLQEEITIRNMRLILETLLLLPAQPCAGLDEFIVFAPLLRPEVAADDSVADVGIVEAAEAVRIALKQYISHKYTRGQNTLIVYLLDPQIEGLVRDSATVADADVAAIMRAVEAEVGGLSQHRQTSVILTTATIRAKFRRLIRFAFPGVHVLSYQELAPDLNIQPIARMSLE